jgi:phosphatidylcholine synthase
MSSDTKTAFEQAARPSAAQSVCAFAVHVLTACGAALSLLALTAAVGENWPLMFFWLALALAVDAVDGALARQLAVKERLPRWSGDTLDLVVDYLSYVFVPTYALVASGLLPAAAAVPAGAVILVTSALYFADRRMKTPDNYFRGFPALWNVVAFYLFLLRPEPWLAVVLVLVLCSLSFVPFPFLHPVRVARFRALNLALLVAWGALALAAIAAGLMPGMLVKLALTAIAILFLAGGFLRRPAQSAS